jgi:hypothetical protein
MLKVLRFQFLIQIYVKNFSQLMQQYYTLKGNDEEGNLIVAHLVNCKVVRCLIGDLQIFHWYAISSSSVPI